MHHYLHWQSQQSSEITKVADSKDQVLQFSKTPQLSLRKKDGCSSTCRNKFNSRLALSLLREKMKLLLKLWSAS